MFSVKTVFLSIFLIYCCMPIEVAESKPFFWPKRSIRSDVIVTKFGPSEQLESNGDSIGTNEEVEDGKPGFMRRQLLRLGNYAKRVGSGINGSTNKVTAFIETMCDIMKSIIPVAAAICQVGQFKFCAAAQGAAENLSVGFEPANLSVQD